MVTVGDDTCVLLSKSANDAHKFHFEVKKEVLEVSVPALNFRIGPDDVVKVGAMAVPSCIWIDLYHFMP